MIRTLVTVPPLLALAAPVFLPAWGIGVALSIADGSIRDVWR